MNTLTAGSKGAILTWTGSTRVLSGKKVWFQIELGAIGLILALLNWSLVWGSCNSAMIFLPSAVADGEWWRVLTHPFVHVTWFHLLLDGAAFFLLYHELQEQPLTKRLACVLASGVGSLLVPLWTDPMISVKGLCGLSGMAHGLMAFSALDLMTQGRDKVFFQIGLTGFAFILVKCLVEIITGKMLFTLLYFGLVGDPSAVTHGGGLLGGAVAWLFCRWFGVSCPSDIPRPTCDRSEPLPT